MQKITYLRRLNGANLTHAQYRVLVTLLLYSNPDGKNSHPGIAKLSKECQMSRSTVADAIAYLKKSGWIWEVSKGKRSKEGIEASVFELRVPPYLVPMSGTKDGTAESTTISIYKSDDVEDSRSGSDSPGFAGNPPSRDEDTSTDDRVIKDQQPLLKTEKRSVPPTNDQDFDGCPECLLVDNDHLTGCSRDPYRKKEI